MDITRTETPKAIIFDLDGTLVDRRRSVERYAELFRATFPELIGERDPHEIDNLFIRADGHGYRASQRPFDIAHALAVPLRADEIDEHWRQHFPQMAVAATGAFEVLSALAEMNISLGLITNGSVSAQNRKLSALNLTHYFTSIAISERIGYKKPDPRIFHHVLAELGVPAVSSWFVGDHPVNDVWAAEQIGIRGFLLPGVAWPGDVKPCGTSISELPELLQHISPIAPG